MPVWKVNLQRILIIDVWVTVWIAWVAKVALTIIAGTTHCLRNIADFDRDIGLFTNEKQDLSTRHLTKQLMINC